MGHSAADRAHLDAAPAELAGAVFHGGIHAECDLGVEAAVDDADRLDAVDVVACPHAAPAEDALVAIDLDERIRVVDGVLVLPAARKRRPLDVVLVRQVLQPAVPGRLAGHAVQRMVGDDQLQRELARLQHLGRVGVDHHALGDRIGAGRLEIALLLDLHQADAAGALRRQRRMMAQHRDVDPGGRGRFVDGLAHLCLEFDPIDGDVYNRHWIIRLLS